MIDLSSFQGIWKAVWLEDNGRKRPAEEVEATRVMIAGDRYTLYLRGHHVAGRITDLNPTEEPGTIDFLSTEGWMGADKRLLGIYLLEDDELTICVAPPEKDRPTALDTRPGTGHWLCFLKLLTGQPLACGVDARVKENTSVPRSLSEA
jgi:uncharacterized protein (TIGR03067 family)